MTVQAPRRTPSSDRTPRAPTASGRRDRRFSAGQSRQAPQGARTRSGPGSSWSSARVLMMTSGAGIVGSKVADQQRHQRGHPADEPARRHQARATAEGGKRPRRPDRPAADGRRRPRKRWAVDDLHADTIIVLHIPASHDQAYLVSIPRDTEVRGAGVRQEPVPGRHREGHRGVLPRRAERRRLGRRRPVDGADAQERDRDQLRRRRDHRLQRLQGRDRRARTACACASTSGSSRTTWLVDGKPMWLAEARKTGKAR